MTDRTRALESAAWAAAEGIATADQRALLEADPVAWRLILERLMDETEDNLDSVSGIEGPERAQVVSDIEADLDRLEAAYDLLLGASGNGAEVLIPTADPVGEVRLQASWANGSIVVWAGGPDIVAHRNADLADRLEALGGPKLGWAVHADVSLPNGLRAAALSIPVEEALGWLVAVGGGQDDDGGECQNGAHAVFQASAGPADAGPNSVETAHHARRRRIHLEPRPHDHRTGHHQGGHGRQQGRAQRAHGRITGRRRPQKFTSTLDGVGLGHGPSPLVARRD